MRYPLEVDCCYMIEEIDDLENESVSNNLIDYPLKACLTEAIMDEENTDNNEAKKIVRDLKSLPIHSKEPSMELKKGKEIDDQQKDEPPKLELKQLANHLRYTYLDKKKNYLIIINVY